MERTILAVTTDSSCLDDRPLEQALQCVMDTLARQELLSSRLSGRDGAPLLAGRRYLVVEDDYFNAMDIVKILDKAGATVFGPVCNAERALEVASDPGFKMDGAILDIRLNSELVYPAAAEFIRRKTPFVFLSGYERASVPAAFRQVPYLSKPCSDEELVSALLAMSRTGSRSEGREMTGGVPS